MTYYVYMLASRPKGAIYVGSTRNLEQRVAQHKSGEVPGHTRRYNIKTLVYFEAFAQVYDALARERSLKKWKRDWKEELIEVHNPECKDMSSDIS